MMSQQEIEETFPKTPVNEEITPLTKGNLLRIISFIGAIAAIFGVVLIFSGNSGYIDIGKAMMVIGSIMVFGTFTYAVCWFLGIAANTFDRE